MKKPITFINRATLRLLLISITMCLATQAWSDDQQSANEIDEDLLSQDSLGSIEAPADPRWFDTTHTVIAESIDEGAEWFDNFFGDPRIQVDSKADAYLKVTLDGYYSGVRDQSKYRIKTKGFVRLPRISKRLKLVLSSDLDSEITGEENITEGSVSDRDDNDDQGIGLNYQFRQAKRHSFSVSGSVKTSLDLYLNARYRFTLPLSEASRLRWTNTLYWKSDKGTGVSSLLDLENRVDAATLWRHSLFAKYGEDTNGLEWSAKTNWLHQLDSKSAISAHLGVSGETEEIEGIKEVWTTVRYRRNFLRPWLFYEIEPGISWHEREDYDLKPTLGLRLEMLF